jgi:hypothetical protein
VSYEGEEGVGGENWRGCLVSQAVTCQALARSGKSEWTSGCQLRKWRSELLALGHWGPTSNSLFIQKLRAEIVKQTAF